VPLHKRQSIGYERPLSTLPELLIEPLSQALDWPAASEAPPTRPTTRTTALAAMTLDARTPALVALTVASVDAPM